MTTRTPSPSSLSACGASSSTAGMPSSPNLSAKTSVASSTRSDSDNVILEHKPSSSSSFSIGRLLFRNSSSTKRGKRKLKIDSSWDKIEAHSASALIKNRSEPIQFRFSGLGERRRDSKISGYEQTGIAESGRRQIAADEHRQEVGRIREQVEIMEKMGVDGWFQSRTYWK